MVFYGDTAKASINEDLFLIFRLTVDQVAKKLQPNFFLSKYHNHARHQCFVSRPYLDVHSTTAGQVFDNSNQLIIIL